MRIWVKWTMFTIMAIDAINIAVNIAHDKYSQAIYMGVILLLLIVIYAFLNRIAYLEWYCKDIHGGYCNWVERVVAYELEKYKREREEMEEERD